MSQMIHQLDRLLEKYLIAVAPNFRLNIWESAIDLNRLGIPKLLSAAAPHHV